MTAGNEKKSKKNSKERKKDTESNDVLILGSGKKVSKVRRFKNKYEKQNKKICLKTPVQVLNIDGHIIQFDSSSTKSSPISYTICHNTECGSVTEFNRSMIGANGFTCNVCDADERDQFEMRTCDGKCKKIKNQQLTELELLNDKTFLREKFYFCKNCINLVARRASESNEISYMQVMALLGKPIRSHTEYKEILWKNWYKSMPVLSSK